MKAEFDYIDGVLLGMVFLGASVMAGIGSFDLFSVTFTDQAFAIGEGVSIAAIMVIGGMLGTIVTNDNTELNSAWDDIQNLEQQYYLAVLGSLALVVGWIFVPEVSSTIQSSDLWGVLYVVGTVVTQIALGWML